MFGGSAGVNAIPNAAMSSNGTSNRSTNATFGTLGDNGPSAIAFAVLVIAYVVWALIQQHQKLRDQVQPKNIALNLHNLFAIMLQVVVALGLFKLLLVLANRYKLPGAKPVSDAVEFAS